MDYVILFISVILMVAYFVTNKIYQQQAGTSMTAGLIFNIVLGSILTVVFWIMNGFCLNISIYSTVMAGLSALFIVSYTMIGFRIMGDEKMALYTIFLMTGGMTIPYVWGLFFLEEPFSWIHTVGLVVIAVSVIISNRDGTKGGVRQILMCVAVFLLNGFVSVVSKEHQINSAAVATIDFVILNSLGKVVLCSAALLFVKEKGKVKKCFDIKFIPVIVVSAIFFGGSYILQLQGAKNLPATVLYPIVTGGGIICTAIASRIFFNEKLTPKLVIGVVLCFLGTCMFL